MSAAGGTPTGARADADDGPPPVGRVVAVDDAGVRTLVIDNPSKRNALDDVTRRALLAALRAALDDASVRVLVLTGAAGTFCAGGELASMPTTDRDAIGARMGELHEITRCLVAGPKPVITAVEGHAYGSGLSLVAASDHAVAARDAHLCASFGRVGLVGDMGLALTLPARVGQGPAAEVLLFAEDLSAERAAAIGLVDRVVDPGDALATARSRAARLAQRAPLALAAAKRLLVPPGRLEALLAAELVEQGDLLASEDFADGRAAFFARQAPVFRGR